MKRFAEIVSMGKWIISTLLLCAHFFCFSQNIPVGRWRSHHSYKNGRILEASENKIFCAVENALFSYDLSDQSLRNITKNDGLSSAGITAIHYAPLSKVLVIGYGSGIIDIIDDDGIHAVKDLKNLTDTTSKYIYDITSYNQQILAATNYGIIVIPLSEKGITDNYQSIGQDAQDLPIYEVLSAHDTLYAITSEGVQHGAFNSNLLDFNNWNVVNKPSGSNARNLCSAAGKAYFILNDTAIVKIQGDTIQSIWSSADEIITIRELNGELHALYQDKILAISESGATLVANFQTISAPNDILFKNQIWVADGLLGLSGLDENSISPTGIASDQISRMRMINGSLYALYGPEANAFNGTFDGMGYNVFSNGSWQYETIPGFDNIIDVAAFNNELIFASTGRGVYFQSQDLIYNTDNSSLTNSTSYPYPVISGLAADNSLWITSYDNNIPLFEYTDDQVWNQFTEAELGTSYPTDLDISQFNVIWVENEEGGYIAAYPEEDRYKFVTTANGLMSNSTNGLAIDTNDELWVATTLGATYFPTASFVFDEFFQEGSPLVFQETEVYDEKNVTAIATDGGNRIWVSDEDGLSVFNNLLTVREHFFTEDNSPLPSNKVLEMDYNPQNGEMFIYTDKGLVSFRSGSSGGNSKHRSVIVFPNPVTPQYDGLVGISGLVTDANVKITDLNGNLIAEVNANGGTASWDLKDYTNSPVRTGVYLIFSSDSEGEETHIAKIAVIR